MLNTPKPTESFRVHDPIVFVAVSRWTPYREVEGTLILRSVYGEASWLEFSKFCGAGALLVQVEDNDK